MKIITVCGSLKFKKEIMEIKLNDLEKQILSLLNEKDERCINVIPFDLYNKLLKYCEQQEEYLICIKLKKLEVKIVNKTIKQLIEDCQPLYSSYASK